MKMKIGSYTIDRSNPPFVIAEMSGNHNSSLEQALLIIDAAATSGAHAIKLQTFNADSMTLNIDASAFKVEEGHKLWGGKKLWDLYRESETPREWHPALFERAKARGILCFSTPFDEASVDFLEQFDPPAYKIASFECTDLPLIRHAASTGRPLIVSTGMASVEEIRRSVDAIREAGCDQIVLLKCTSTYPADPVDTNARAIPLLRELFDCEVGLSDHTGGIGAAVASVALGASVIEKHFVISRDQGGIDAEFSLESEEFAVLVAESCRAWQSLGMSTIGPSDAEQASLRYRRSIFVAADIRAGEFFTRDNLRRVRPGYGLEPQFFDFVLGRRAAADISLGTPLTWELIENNSKQ